ncbi:MAG: hypothetical protein AVDCRST_MAG45-556, partial [uncultured Solirubrobacterales bacterium]
DPGTGRDGRAEGRRRVRCSLRRRPAGRPQRTAGGQLKGEVLRPAGRGDGRGGGRTGRGRERRV